MAPKKCANFGPGHWSQCSRGHRAASTWHSSSEKEQREGGRRRAQPRCGWSATSRSRCATACASRSASTGREAEGRVPALFAASPYQHEFDSVPAFPLFLWRETGPIEWYVAQGYAYVHADVRGSGRSEGEFGFMDADRAGGLRRADRLDRTATLVQRPRRRHRPVLLRHGAMADGDTQPARPRLHRALRRAGRPVPLLELSRRHFLQLPFVLVRQPARRQPASPRRRRGASADALRSGRRHHRAHARRRLVARALRRSSGSARSRCRCCRSGIGARWACTCAATSSASRK